MQAGFARQTITPPAGTRMQGFAGRDRDHGCTGVHDDLFVRALYLEHADRRALLVAFDLCFLDRELADRLKGAIGRRVDLAPRQILLNTSHTHAGPDTHRWAYGDFLEAQRLYLRELEAATVQAVCDARAEARPVTLSAGMGRTTLPMNRRRPRADGTIAFAPNPDGVVCNALPVCRLVDEAGQPVCLLFSVSCHPSTIGGFDISADYPGVAMRELDEHLGAPVSMFLQGTGGDAKPRVIGEGGDRWRAATWDDVADAGRIVAQDVIRALDAGLDAIEPELGTSSVEMGWALEQPLDRAGYQSAAEEAETAGDDVKRRWALRQVELLDRGQGLPTRVSVTAHGVQLGRGVRLIGLEGEPVAVLGNLIIDLYEQGVTFPLGYTDGAQLYLPTSAMLDEGGYEVDSYYEYGFPARLAPGMEEVLLDSLRAMRGMGVQ